jgi:hypothetical protein
LDAFENSGHWISGLKVRGLFEDNLVVILWFSWFENVTLQPIQQASQPAEVFGCIQWRRDVPTRLDRAGVVTDEVVERHAVLVLPAA